MIRFDTRDKKPTLWNVAALTGVLAAVLAVFLLLGAEQHAFAISLSLGLYLVLVVILLIRAYFGQLRYNPYSYNTIFYMGIALFLVAVLILLIRLTVLMVRQPELYAASAVLHLLLGSAKIYMLLTFPFILVFSAALCVSNISLIRHEGFRTVNMLGIILSFLLVGGELFLFFFDFAVSGSQREVMIHDLFANLFAAVYLYFECMLLGIMVADAIVVRYEPEPDKDFLIILGCGIRRDGTPSPLLRGRIDRALRFAEKQKAQTGKDLIFVTSGGQGPDEPISESASMKRYLLEQGVPEERILEEDRSSSTFENMKFSKAKIREVNPQGKIAFSTTNYHVFRGGLYARRVKMRAVGMGAKTRWYFWPNAAVREFVGLLTEHKLKQGLIFGGMVVFYVVLTLLAYR
ncbi:MAG: YdcF family protein [Oscillospiraceae bacterium]|nr:YdcF family protein [Oscillospiraceae bacterium]